MNFWEYLTERQKHKTIRKVLDNRKVSMDSIKNYFYTSSPGDQITKELLMEKVDADLNKILDFYSKTD